jgi:acyl carrier protein
MTAEMGPIDSIVKKIVAARTSRTIGSDELRGDVPLGADGLGLDSIAIAEVLLDCQQHFGVNVTSLLEHEPLTLRRLIEHLERETAA